MRVFNLSTHGITEAFASLCTGATGGEYYAVTHGEQGRGRWQVKFPLAVREFPVPPIPPTLPFTGTTTRNDGLPPWSVFCPQHGKQYAQGDRRCPVCEAERVRVPLQDKEFRLFPLNRQDARGNELSLLVKSNTPDGLQLILWSLSPGYRGDASYEIKGMAQRIAYGMEAQGNAGRMGGAACPVILVAGPCELTWNRSGRLYGSAADWTAVFDGDTWTVAPVATCVLEQAALTY